jgi:hypothetical protein
MKPEELRKLLLSQIYQDEGAAMSMARGCVPREVSIRETLDGYSMRNVQAVPPHFQLVDVGEATFPESIQRGPDFPGFGGVIFVPYPDSDCMNHTCHTDTSINAVVPTNASAVGKCNKHYLCPKNTVGPEPEGGPVGRKIFYNASGSAEPQPAPEIM